MRMRLYQYGTAALSRAAYNGHLPVVEYLLERGADPNAQDDVNEQFNIDLWFVTLA